MVYLSLWETHHLKLRHAGQLQLLELEGLCFVADGGNPSPSPFPNPSP